MRDRAAILNVDMPDASRRILAIVTALAVFAVAVNCACAGSLVMPRAERVATKACCAGKHQPIAPVRSHSHPAAPCPHCLGAALQVELAGGGKVKAPASTNVASPFMACVALPFLRPTVPDVHRTGRQLTFHPSPPTLLALACASLT